MTAANPIDSSLRHDLRAIASVLREGIAAESRSDFPGRRVRRTPERRNLLALAIGLQSLSRDRTYASSPSLLQVHAGQFGAALHRRIEQALAADPEGLTETAFPSAERSSTAASAEILAGGA